MTTPQAMTGSTTEQWEPYPHLEKEEKDMRQRPVEKDLELKLGAALTPGHHYPYHPRILIGSEIPIYYGERDPVTRRFPNVRPDILIALNVDADAIWRRVGYDPIQNRKPPDAVVEIAPPSTYRNDAGHKRDVYQMLEVPEYWRFDPTGGEMFGQAVIGERLAAGQYERLPLRQYDDGAVGSTSPMLNLNFRYRGNELFTIHDPATGREYEHPEQRAARLEEENRRQLPRRRRRLFSQGFISPHADPVPVGWSLRAQRGNLVAIATTLLPTRSPRRRAPLAITLHAKPGTRGVIPPAL